MKRFLSVLTFCILIFISKPAFAADIPVYIDSIKLEFTDAKPQSVNNRVMVPMRIIFEKLGADVQWNEETQTATAKKGDSVISLSIDNAIAKLNGVDKKLDTPAIKMSDRTYVPIRFVSESLGAKVYWNDTSNTVYIYSKDYLANMNEVKLKLIISHKFGNKIKTSLGEIDVMITPKAPSAGKEYLFDYNIISAINQFNVNKILNDVSYSQEQKTLFKEELKQFQNDIANYVINLTSDSYKIVGSYIFIDGYQDTEKKIPIIKLYYNWANFNYYMKTADHNGFRWAEDIDTFKFQ